MITNQCEFENKKQLVWQDFHAAGFEFDAPFILRLADGEYFSADHVLRIIPKKRMVVTGLWQGEPVVAKIFFDANHAKRHMEKDVAGIKILLSRHIPTPLLYYDGASEDRRVYIAIFEHIFDAKSFDEIWKNKESCEQSFALLQAIVSEIATQHVLGVLQKDLHFKNFLISNEKIYLLDGSDILCHHKRLTKEISIKNIVLFLSQLGVGFEKEQEALFHYYAKLRGWLLKEEDSRALFLSIQKQNDLRWRRFHKKIFRSSSYFACMREGQYHGMYDRYYSSKDFLSLLKNPESVFHDANSIVLKEGRSTTVIKIKIQNHELVVKRYNVKNIWHFLRRFFRKTRAHTAWGFAHKMIFFGISTAKPVAFIEQRLLGCHGKSYYLTEYVKGEHSRDYFIRHQNEDNKMIMMINRISSLLKNLAKIEITHGDLKISNILINAHQEPVLIDLDGTTSHLSFMSLQETWQKELKRFLENFSDLPHVQHQFNMEFGKNIKT